jgi:uncharacterized BrkB/YihY/UPF0761 family membrane protein
VAHDQRRPCNRPRHGRLTGRCRPSSAWTAFQRNHPWAGFPLAVVYKYADDQGGYLAALITSYGLLSLFPLLLLLLT